MVALVSGNCFYCWCCQTVGVCFHLILDQHEKFLPWILNLLARLQKELRSRTIEQLEKIRGGKILKVFKSKL